MLPRLDGLEVCKRLRATSTRADHHAHGARRRARQGARPRARRRRLHHEAVLDPRVPQPRARAAAPRVGAAARAARRRSRSRSTGLRIDPARRVGRASTGRPVQLTYVEFELLRTLAARPGRVFSRQTLLEALWGGSDYREPRTIDVHVRHLREKLERDPREPRVHPDRARRRLPLPRPVKPLVASVGARLSARAAASCVAGALALVYLIVVPSLQSRARSTRGSSQLERSRRRGSRRELPSDRLRWPRLRRGRRRRARTRGSSSTTRSARRPRSVVVGDSQGMRLERRRSDDPIALRAAERRSARDGTIDARRPALRRGGAPVPGRLGRARLVAAARAAADGRASSRGALLRRRRARAASLALVRRVRGRAAVRAPDPPARAAPPSGSRPGGSTSRSSTTARDEVGQLARAFDRMRLRLAAARPRPARVHRQRLARAAHAALLARRLPRAARRRGARRARRGASSSRRCASRSTA